MNSNQERSQIIQNSDDLDNDINHEYVSEEEEEANNIIKQDVPIRKQNELNSQRQQPQEEQKQTNNNQLQKKLIKSQKETHEVDINDQIINDPDGQEDQDEGEQQTEEQDKRSVFVQNVEYQTTQDQLKEHFKECGNIIRVTIPTDRFTGPKGYAYIEFEDVESAENAIQSMNDSTINLRQIKVISKRTNKRFQGNRRGFAGGSGRRPPRGAFHGRGNMFYGRGAYMFNAPVYPRGRRGYRGFGMPGYY